VQIPIRVYGAKLYGHGVEYYTIVFDENELTLCKLIEKTVVRRHKYTQKIDEMVMRVRIEREDYGTCFNIPYNEIIHIDYMSKKDKIILFIKLKTGAQYIFHIGLRKKKLVQKGVNYVKNKIGLKYI